MDRAGYTGPGAVALHRFADRLTGDAVVRGLIGPREADRIWSRHLLNCAAVAPLFPADARVVDVGTGAGLPGIVLACVRPDLRVDLVDSLHRRTAFLSEVVTELDLAGRVRVITGRAEDAAVVDVVGGVDWVTARAVAPLARLAGWCLPLLTEGGTLAALKGERAAEEARRDAGAVRRLHGEIDGVREFVVDGEPPTRVVIVRREASRQNRRTRTPAGRTARRTKTGRDGGPTAGRTRS